MSGGEGETRPLSLFNRSIKAATMFPARAHQKSLRRKKKKKLFSYHAFCLKNSFSMSILFTNGGVHYGMPGYTDAKQSSRTGGKQFWNSGGAIDFSGSTDKRAFELERRIILSHNT